MFFMENDLKQPKTLTVAWVSGPLDCKIASVSFVYPSSSSGYLIAAICFIASLNCAKLILRLKKDHQVGFTIIEGCGNVSCIYVLYIDSTFRHNMVNFVQNMCKRKPIHQMLMRNNCKVQDSMTGNQILTNVWCVELPNQFAIACYFVVPKRQIWIHLWGATMQYSPYTKSFLNHVDCNRRL